MIKKLVSAKTKTITGAALVLAAASFLSRIIGVIRDRIFADQFGAGAALDIYYAAFRIPDLVYNLLIVGALSAGFIPVFTTIWQKNKDRAWKLTNDLINTLALLLVLLSLVLYITMPWLTELVVPGFTQEQTEQTVLLSRIMLLSPLLLGLSGIASGVLQSLKHFFIYSLTPIFYNVGIIIGAIFFVPQWGLEGLAYGVVLGATLHLAIQLPTLWQQGFGYKLQLDYKSKDLYEIARLMIPRTLTLATTQINLIVITILASTLTVGSLTIFNFANNLQYFPVGIVGVSFALAAFPTLSDMFARNDRHAFIDHLANTIRQILFFIIPLTIVFLLLRAQIVRVVLGSGKFDWPATIATANALALFALSFFAQCLIPLLTRAFYAMHDTWKPLIISFVSVLINIIGALTLKDILGVPGLALAFSIAAVFQLLVLWFTLRQRIQKLNAQDIFTSFSKIAIAAIAMAVSMQLLKAPIAATVDMTRFWGIFTQGAIVGIAGLLIYAVILYFLRSAEMMELVASAKKQWLRFAPVQGEVNEPDEL